MKRFKRMTCFLVAALMLMSVFTACGSQAKQDPAASSTAEQTTTAVDPQQEAALDTSPITLKVYAKYAWWGRKGDNLTQSLTGKELTKLTGITWDVITPPTGDEEQTKLNVMLSSGDYPDMMLLDKDAILRKYIETGALIPLDELIEKYGPDIQKEVTMDYLKIFRGKYAADDKLYFLPNQFATDAKTFQGFGTGFAIREKIYEEIGKPAIKTTDDLYNVLKTIQAKNIKVNGKDMIPIEISGVYQLLAGVFGTRLAPIGDGAFSVQDDGTTTHLINDPKMKEAFRFANKLFREKLMDQEEYTQGAEAGTEKSNQGRYAVYGHTNCYGWITDIINAQLEKTVQDKMVMLETPLAPGVEKAQMTFVGLSGWNVLGITKNCKYPERALSMMNLLSSEKGQIMGRIGPEGVVWTNTDGKITLTPEYKEKAAKDRDAFNKEVGFDQWNWLGNKKFDYAFMAMDDDTQRVEKERMGKIVSAGTWYLPGADSIMIDPKGPAGIASQKIKDYYELWIKKLVMQKSDADFEKTFTDMQENIGKLGVKELETEITKQIQAAIAAAK
jgi:putative aldouronate transport system substrate-binding protein